jgi:hypothetical protein
LTAGRPEVRRRERIGVRIELQAHAQPLQQARQVPQACDLRLLVGLAGLEPATERL